MVDPGRYVLQPALQAFEARFTPRLLSCRRSWNGPGALLAPMNEHVVKFFILVDLRSLDLEAISEKVP